MKRINLSFILVLLVAHLFAQNPLAKQWDKRFGGTNDDWVYCFQQTSDGGYIMGGSSHSGIGGDKTQPLWGDYDYWIVKLDSSGNKQWDKTFGGTDYDALISLQQTTDGGYILGGQSFSGINGDKTQATYGDYDYWILKLDSSGNKQWDKDFGGTDEDYLNSIIQTTDGGYMLGGRSRSGVGGVKTQITHGGFDYWIVKIDSAGIKQWDKDFGGTGYDEIFSLQQTMDGGYILGGGSNSGIGGSKTLASFGSFDFWVVRIDSIGNKLWEKEFGGTGFDALLSLKITTDGGFILAGFSDSGINGNKSQASWGLRDYWIVKLNSSGIKQWDKDFGGTQGEDIFGNVSQTLDGGFLIAGGSFSGISGNKTEYNYGAKQTWIVKTDSLGIKEWDKTLFTKGTDDTGFALQTSDGCFVFTNYNSSGSGGYKSQSAWNGTLDMWIIKFCTPASPPVAHFSSSDSSFCQNTCIDFFETSVNASQWHWYFPGAQPSFSTLEYPTNICYNNAGNFDVTLVVCNQLGCDTLTFQNFIHVDGMPLINLGNDTLICDYDSLILDAGTGSYSYLWSDNSSLQTIVVNSTGIYSVTVTSGNCINSDSIFITTQPCLTPAISIASTDTNFCDSQCINFFDLSQNNPTSWQWYFNSANPDTSTLQNPTNICYNNFGTYDVLLIACNMYGCDSLKLSNFIHCYQNPVDSIWGSYDTLFSLPYSFYQWYEVTSGLIAGATNQYYVPSQLGSYYCVVNDSIGCVATSNTIVLTSSSQLQVESYELSIQPNPNNGSFEILLSDELKNSNAKIQITDLPGQVIYQSKSNEKNVVFQLDIEGMYFVTVTSGKEIITKKIIVQH